MTKTAEDYEGTYTHPELRERLKEEIKASDRGGRPGQWSARKSQLLKREYEAAGGGYEGEPTESQRHLHEWTEEEWQTAEGDERAREGAETHRYLPKAAWEAMSPAERKAADAAKRAGSRSGRQFVANTPAARRATTVAHFDEMTVPDVVRRLGDLSDADLRAALEHERGHRGRKTLLARMDSELARRG